MKREDILRVFSETEALLEGHFVLNSGKHSGCYLNKDAIYPHIKKVSFLCLALAENFTTYGVDLVVAPAMGGITLAQWTAFHLMELTGKEVLWVYAEKDGKEPEGLASEPLKMVDKFIFKRGYDKIIPGRRILVVEDVVTTGGSLKRVIKAIHHCGGDIVSAAALCNRSGQSEEDVAENLNTGYFYALADLKLEAWEEDDCPLCKQGVPINISVGKGKEYLEKKKTQ
ncbi:MAG: phosphoribosyltransferase family protein [Candidatus Pacebacteria bacterium]|nr:phosphoribosyltransferase family protein [Candidatus Paceibacterota bacterium]